jgi:hypothetical protein
MLKTRKKVAVWLGLPASVAAVAYGAARLLAQELYGPVPSTVLYEKILYDVPSGRLRATEQSVYAARSDGATCQAVRRKAPDGTEAVLRTIRDPNRGVAVSVDEFTKSLITLGMTSIEVGSLRRPRAACRPGVPDPSVTILGYGTHHIRFEVPCQECVAGHDFTTQTMDKWVSPELGCLPLRVVRGFVTKDGKAVISSVREAKAIVLGEPDQAWFDIPNYPERSPSQVIREFESKYALPPLTKPYIDLEEQDRRYRESRKGLPTTVP